MIECVRKPPAMPPIESVTLSGKHAEMLVLFAQIICAREKERQKNWYDEILDREFATLSFYPATDLFAPILRETGLI
jgi:hypothetical protein